MADKQFIPIRASDRDVPRLVGGTTAIVFTKRAPFGEPDGPEREMPYSQLPIIKTMTGVASAVVSANSGDLGVNVYVDKPSGTIRFMSTKANVSGTFTALITITTIGSDAYPPFWTPDSGVLPAVKYWKPGSTTFGINVVVWGHDMPWMSSDRSFVAEVGKPFGANVQFNSTSNWMPYYSFLNCSLNSGEAGSNVGDRISAGLPIVPTGGDPNHPVVSGLTVSWPGVIPEFGLAANGPFTIEGIPTTPGIAYFTVTAMFGAYGNSGVMETAWHTYANSVTIDIVVSVIETKWPVGKPVVMLTGERAESPSITLREVGLMDSIDLNGPYDYVGVINGKSAYQGYRSGLANTHGLFQIFYSDDAEFTGWMFCNITTNPPSLETAYWTCATSPSDLSIEPPPTGWVVENGDGPSGSPLIIHADLYLKTIGEQYPFFAKCGEYNELPFYRRAKRGASEYLYFTEDRWRVSPTVGAIDALHVSVDATFPPVFSSDYVIAENDWFAVYAYAPPRAMGTPGEVMLPAYSENGVPVMALALSPSGGRPIGDSADAANAQVMFGMLDFFRRHNTYPVYPYTGGILFSASARAKSIEESRSSSNSYSESVNNMSRCNRTDCAHPFHEWKTTSSKSTADASANSTTTWECHLTDVPLSRTGPHNTVVWLEYKGPGDQMIDHASSHRDEAENFADGVKQGGYYETGSGAGASIKTADASLVIQPYSGPMDSSLNITDILTAGAFSASANGEGSASTTRTTYWREVVGEGPETILRSSTASTSSKPTFGGSYGCRGVNRVVPQRQTPGHLSCPLGGSVTYRYWNSAANMSYNYYAFGSTSVVASSGWEECSSTWSEHLIDGEIVSHDGVYSKVGSTYTLNISFSRQTGEVGSYTETNSPYSHTDDDPVEYEVASVKGFPEYEDGELGWSWSRSRSRWETYSSNFHEAWIT